MTASTFLFLSQRQKSFLLAGTSETIFLTVNFIYAVFQYIALRKKSPYSELFWSLFSRIWNEYGDIRRISPYSVQMRENRDQNNSEYGHILCSVGLK